MKVLLLHGWPVSERVWVSQVCALRDAGFDPIAPHLYGRGPSIDDWAAQLLREIDGPLVAGRRVDGRVLRARARAPSARAGRRHGARRLSRRRRLVRAPEVSGRSRSSSCGRASAPTWPTPDANLEHLAVAQEAMRDRLDLTGVAASFGGPLLVCVGDRDELVSVDEARGARGDGALDGTLEVFPDAGHFVAVDQPAKFNAVLLDFLSQWKT